MSRVSIHARHATGDEECRRMPSSVHGVSIHARHATGDVPVLDAEDACVFQFTPVMRRATILVPSNADSPNVTIHARHATGD